MCRVLTARRDDASSEQEESAPAPDACSDHLFSPPLLACPSLKLVSTRNSQHHILPLSLYLSSLSVPFKLPCFSRSSALRLPRPALTLLPCSAALSDTQHTAVQPSPTAAFPLSAPSPPCVRQRDTSPSPLTPPPPPAVGARLLRARPPPFLPRPLRPLVSSTARRPQSDHSRRVSLPLRPPPSLSPLPVLTVHVGVPTSLRTIP